MTIVRDARGFTGLYFPGHWTRPDRSAFGPQVEPEVGSQAEPQAEQADGFDDAVTQLSEYFAGDRREFELPLAPYGTAEALAAWRLISRIPYGATATYGALAGQLGEQISARDFGRYVAHNLLSILVPCHRVIGADGSLTGYAGGLKRKRHLLELEGALRVEQRLW